MPSRRNFIRTCATTMGFSILPAFLQAKELNTVFSVDFQRKLVSPNEFIQDEDFWYAIRLAYSNSPNIINLNSGGMSPSPRITQEALETYMRQSNEAPTYYMWRVLDQNREPLRENLALLAGCSPEEIALNRNCTEGLNTIIFGLPLKAGDEVVTSIYDYPNMIHAWQQREKREGIKVIKVEIDMPNENENDMLAAYTAAFTDKTKLVHITHITNWNGQILPVKKIAEEAHKRGIEVMVDGAHSFALLDYKIPDLDCDYFATSLHKWLCAPFGSGMMYVRKDKISKIMPLLSADQPDSKDIRKFEQTGTRNFASEMAIGYSLDFHNMIGTHRKQKRLHYLKNYWMEQVSDVKGIHFFTPKDAAYSCAIGTFAIEGKKSVELASELFHLYKIHTTSSDCGKVNAVRVTPNVFTSVQDLDKLVRGIRHLGK